MSEKSPENLEAPSPSEQKPRDVAKIVKDLGKTAVKGSEKK